MVDRGIALEALSALCGVPVTWEQRQTDQAGGAAGGGRRPGPGLRQLDSTDLIRTVWNAEQIQQVSPSGSGVSDVMGGCIQRGPEMFTIGEEFFAPEFDKDFRKMSHQGPAQRGGEPYKRPNGWIRIGLKVLGKYKDNTWLGPHQRPNKNTSVAGEWPVSYHGTSSMGVVGIVKGNYKAGSGDAYGRGIYSSPDISEAEIYTSTFTSKKDGKKYKVILQNRINPEYKKICDYKLYWLIKVTKGTSKEEEEELVKRAIRPYGLLIKEV